MRAVIVYESSFGNTARLASAIAEELRSSGDIALVEAATAPALIEADLLITGGPTHVMGLSRARTRQDAARQQNLDDWSERGLREWLDGLERHHGPIVAAAFDTRVKSPLPGSAASAAARRLRHKGFSLVAPPETFWVTGTAGPLHDGEVERARAWARAVAAAIPTSVPRDGRAGG